MKNGNKYLEKVRNELTVYQKYLIDDAIVLTDKEQENFDKLTDFRSWLKEGYSDAQVLSMSKRVHHLQERRTRELLTITYEIFAELRRSKSIEGVKYNEAEILDEAAQEIKEEAKKILGFSEEDDGDLKKSEKYQAYVQMMRLWKDLKKESATIKGAYEKQVAADEEERKKPTTNVFIQVNTKEDVSKLRQVIDITHDSVK